MNTTTTALAQLEAAAAAGKLSASAAANIRTWLTQPYLRDYAPQVAEHLADGKWTELEEAFWTTIPFGTGGRRGRMYPIGCNAINDRTIGETAQGLADYVKKCQASKGTAPFSPTRKSGGSPIGHSRAPLPMIRGIGRGSSPSFAARSWRPRALRSTFSTATAARRSFRSPCGTSNAIAALSSRPATIRPATTP